MTDEVDYLTEHQTIEDQKFCCMSFAADPEKKSNICGIKIWGNFKTYELACQEAKRFSDMEDEVVPVYVGEVGKWCPFKLDPNDTSQIEDIEYRNKELNNIMKAHYNNKVNTEMIHNLRKNEQINNIYTEDYNNRKSNLKTMKEELEKLNKDVDGEDIIKKAEETIEKYEKEMKSLKKKQKNLEKESLKLKSKIEKNKVTGDGMEVREELLDKKEDLSDNE